MSKFSEARIDGLLERISQIEPKASSTERAMDKVRQKLIEDMPVKTGIFQSRFAKMAIAAAIIIAVGVAIALLMNNTKPGTVPNQKNIVKEDQQPEIVEPEMPTVAEQLAKVEGLYAAGDIDGLIAALGSKEPAVARASAGFLGMIGDVGAIEPLRNLAARWQDAGDNPFQKAIDDINKRIRVEYTPPEPVEPDEIPAEPNAVETGETVREYEQPQNIYITYTQIAADGNSVTEEIWLKMPDHFRKSNPDSTVIDNGVDRLTLNVQKKTALFEDSWVDVQPFSQQYMLSYMNMFRGQMPEELTCTKNEKESTAKTIVYDMTIKSSVKGSGKVWASAKTMLVNRIEAEIKQDPNSTNQQGPEAAEITFDYSPIPDSIFSMKVPKEYNTLPRKERNAFTGQVIDEEGNPVAGAKVQMKSWDRQNPITRVSDSEGFFALGLPPNRSMINTPVAVWATIDGDDERIAWTLLRSDHEISQDKNQPLGGEILGDPGEFDGTKRQIEKADGIVLQMEKAGIVYGQVTNILGEALADAEVKVEFGIFGKLGNESIGQHYLWPTTTKTDENGYYVVGNLPRLWNKTRRSVWASAEDHNSKYINRKSDGPLDEMEVNFELLLSGITVRGTLHDNYGKPLDQRQVSVGAGNGNTSIGGKTDKNGRFEIANCAIAAKLTVTAELKYNTYPSHDTKKRVTYVYYPDVSTDIIMQEDKFEYEVELIAELPELTFEVYVVDSAGNPLPFYPVELGSRGSSRISYEWKTTRRLDTRADENGYCKLTNVPNIKKMKLVLWPGKSVHSDNKLDEEEQKLMREVGREHQEKYAWKELPIEIVEGVKDYEITAVVPTKEEAEKERIKKAKKQAQP